MHANTFRTLFALLLLLSLFAGCVQAVTSPAPEATQDASLLALNMFEDNHAAQDATCLPAAHVAVEFSVNRARYPHALASPRLADPSLPPTPPPPELA